MSLDLNALRIAVMLLSFAGFVALVVHAWSRRQREAHVEAAELPFQDESEPPGNPAIAAHRGGEGTRERSIVLSRSEP